MTKAMHAEGVEWGEDHRGAARQSLAELLERQGGALSRRAGRRPRP